MPVVPQYDNLQSGPNGLPNARLAAPDMPDVAGQRAQQLGQGLMQAGQGMGRIALDMQNDANLVRVQDAYNRALQAKLDLTYDPNNGFLAQKGDAALNRPDGKPLAQEYVDKYNRTIQDITAGLGNDAQKRMFAEHAGALSNQLHGEIDQHMLGEYKQYHLSTNEGTIKLEASNAALNYNNPAKIEQSIANARQAVYNIGKLKGDSAQETMANQLAIASGIHLGILDAAVRNGDLNYASAYLKQQQDKAEHGSQEMSGEDLLKANALLLTHANAAVSQAAVDAATRHFQDNVNPSIGTRLSNIITGMESGGRDYNPDGTPVMSPKGALYAQQVMPSTAKNPGFGIVPARDNSPAEYNRVGSQYIAALTSKYGGDPAKIMAAYNAGPGAVDNAIAQAHKNGGDWTASLPDETRNYVAKGMAKLLSGGGSPSMPTEMDFVNQAVSALPPGTNPLAIKATKEAATQQYNMIVKSRNEQADQIVQQAQQAMIANGGNFNAIDSGIKMQLAQLVPGKYDDLQKFGVALAGNVKTNLALYGTLVSHPDALYQMKDGEFNLLQTEMAPADFKHLAQVRSDLQNGKKSSESPLSIDSPAVNDAITNRLTSLGITPPKRDDKDGLQQVGSVQKFVRDTIMAQQQQAGRKLKPDEVTALIDTLFAKNIAFQNVIGGFVTKNYTQPMLAMKVGDIPEDSLTDVKAALANHGIANPTDDQIIRTYWSGKLKRR